MKIYSPSLNQFLAPEFQEQYEASGAWPADALQVSDEVFFEMRDAVDAGKVMQPGKDGHPVAVEPAEDPLDALQAAAVKHVNAEYDRRVLAISAGYPAAERESWPVQTSEARALRADVGASTPWIDAAAAARGLDRAELAQRIVALDDQYRAVHGALSGTRQRLEGEIRAAETAEAVAAIAWPEAA